MPDVQLLDIVKKSQTYEGIKSIAVPTPSGGEEIYFQPDLYSGDTIVTPSDEQVILRTADTYLEQNVVINAVPYEIEPNGAGGNTAIIGTGGYTAIIGEES